MTTTEHVAAIPRPRTADGPTTYDGDHRCTFPEVVLEDGRDPDDPLPSGAHVLAPCVCGERPIDHLGMVEGHNADLEAAILAQEPHRALYHWAPATRRKQIIRYGLRPGMRVTTSTGLTIAGVICLADSPAWAWALSGNQRHAPRGSWDLWQTSLDVLTDPIVLPSTDRQSGLHEVRTEHRIYKRDLWLAGTRQK